MKQLNIKQLSVCGAIIVIGLISRFLPHPPNVTAIAAVSLFAGAVLSNRFLAIMVPLFIMYLSDFTLNNTLSRSFFPEQEGIVFWAGYMGWLYLGIIITVLIGSWTLKSRDVKKLIIGSISASLVFWILSNLGIWLQPAPYPNTSAGLLSCYGAAIPFLRNSLIGDLVFTMIVFGAYDYVNVRYFKGQQSFA